MQEELNKQPITKKREQDFFSLPLSTFPVVEDFSIEFRETDMLGKHLFFFSHRFGKLFSFVWVDHADAWVRKHYGEGQTDYLGISKIFDELEQGWQAAIFSDEQWVYILETNQDPSTNWENIEFPRWFKVKKEKYIKEWEKIVEQSKN